MSESKQKKEKSKGGLIVTLILMNLMIGFVAGFTFGSEMFFNLDTVQETLMNFDQEVIIWINNIDFGI